MSKQEKIICLGREFNSEEERREYFRNELRSKLPELKKIEGFPIGEDEDIINLSDPPYYTACPNPWLNDFIAEWEKDKENIKGRTKDFHVDEPYAADVSEGKNNPIYMAHSYHTKVPHTAIMRYLYHYTEPGDIVLDGFSGTGMTGVAGQLCNKPDSSLKYLIEEDFKKRGKKINQGNRKVILGDLSPIASFISYSFNSKKNVEEIKNRLLNVLNKIQTDFKWLYETKHTNNVLGKIEYTIWSDVFSCPVCANELIFWDVARDEENETIKEEFNCDKCNSILTKRKVEKVFVTKFNQITNKAYKVKKEIPVVICYKANGRRFYKKPDNVDLELIEKISNYNINNWLPQYKINEGDKTSEYFRNGYYYTDDLFFKRTLIILSEFYSKFTESIDIIYLTSILLRASKLFRWSKNQAGPMMGTIYLASATFEINPFNLLSNKSNLWDVLGSINTVSNDAAIYVGSASEIQLSDSTIDYIFTDPPFGANLMYSELNFIWESWLKVVTNNKMEAIENQTQKKSTLEYQDIMTKCFSEYYRILKPNKWMTVEFSNTSAAVWNGIQTALQRVGFVIANVAGLDKKQGSFNAVTNATSVKQDLVISCYKPSLEFEQSFNNEQNKMVVWDFVYEHMQHLPAHIGKDNNTTAIVERSPKILFDRLITFYLMRGLPVPIDARDFQEGLKHKFIERDGMYFTAEQAAEYDEKKAKSPNFVQLSLIVTNESDAIEWLKDRLRKQSQKYQDIMPEFRIATQSLRKGDTLPELQDILNESFIQEADGKWRTPDPNEAKDREALRSKVLLKEFTGYVTAISQPKAKKLKEVRVEALRAGFKNSWEQKDFKTIVTLGDMIPQNILLEDEQLLMYYDIAKDRV